MFSVGKFLDNIKEKRCNIISICLVTSFGFLLLVSKNIGYLYKWGIAFFLISLWFIFYLKSNIPYLNSVKLKIKKFSFLGKYILGLSLIIGFLPSPIYITGLNKPSICRWGHFYSYKELSVFQPQKFLELMKPFSRMVSDFPNSLIGNDLRAVENNVLGGATRNT